MGGRVITSYNSSFQESHEQAEGQGVGTGPLRFWILRRPRMAATCPMRQAAGSVTHQAAQNKLLTSRAANNELPFPGGREQSGRAWKGCS